MSDVVNQSYYNADYHRDYYEKNRAKMIKRSKDNWAALTDKEKKEYYEDRKQKRRKLKKESTKD